METISPPEAAANLTSTWTDTLKSAARQVTTQQVPSAKDLLLAGPRLASKLGSMVMELPSSAYNLVVGGAAETSGLDHVNVVVTSTTVLESTAQAASASPPGLASQISLESGRSVANMLAYATSRWSLACIVMSVVINRTQVYGSTRRPIRIGLRTNVALRILPVALLLWQVRTLLQSIQCQTSPDFASMKWGNASMHSELMFTQNGGWLHDISSTLLFGASDQSSCQTVEMIPLQPDQLRQGHHGGQQPLKTRGSLSRLWPYYQSLCLSQFVEVLSCAAQGRHPRTETAMSLFEHSLAFAEAEAAVSTSLGWGAFGGTSETTVEFNQNDPSAGTESSKDVAKVAITRAMIMRRLNTSPEVLFVGVISAFSHISSHLLAMFDLQGRFRLLSTGFYGTIFMATVAWSIWTFSLDDPLGGSMLRFPTVCIIGFIPHVIIILGISLCACIYGLAVTLSVMSLPHGVREQQGNFWDNVKIAHENMQASVPLMNVRVHMHEDFYTALLKVGYSILNVAKEAVYLNETPEVVMKPRTWLEEDRLRELDQWTDRDVLMDGSQLRVLSDQEGATSGYGRERVPQNQSKVKPQYRPRNGGHVGAADRTGRFIMAMDFVFGVAKLILRWITVMLFKTLNSFGIARRPSWVSRFVQKKVDDHKVSVQTGRQDDGLLDFWLVNENGQLMLPTDDHVDVELEMKKRLKGDNPRWSTRDDEQLDNNIYGWWLSGGWFGTEDNSGHFAPTQHELEDDNTSMISTTDSEMTTTDLMDVNPWEWDSKEDEEDNDDGRRTPTQRSPQRSRESTPLNDTPLSSHDLSRLLNPQTPEQRADAQTLAVHLASDGIMTRSRYRAAAMRQKSQVLTTTRQRPQHLAKTRKLTSQEEAELLEYLIIQRRAFPNSARSPGAPSFADASTPKNTGSWAEHAPGMEPGGPQCVVCQTAPRSIIAWPCRCLSLCDDCRVSLAMNNFNQCVCCRREVSSFSRIFVP